MRISFLVVATQLEEIPSDVVIGRDGGWRFDLVRGKATATVNDEFVESRRRWPAIFEPIVLRRDRSLDGPIALMLLGQRIPQGAHLAPLISVS